jgi:hypothetical protein
MRAFWIGVFTFIPLVILVSVLLIDGTSHGRTYENSEEVMMGMRLAQDATDLMINIEDEQFKNPLDRTYLFMLVSPSDNPDLVYLTIKHYVLNGVYCAHIYVDIGLITETDKTSSHYQHLKAIINIVGVKNVLEHYASPVSDAQRLSYDANERERPQSRQWLSEAEARANMPPNSWIIHANTGEFHEYPDKPFSLDVPTKLGYLLRELEEHEVSYVRGLVSDRLSRTGTLISFPTEELQRMLSVSASPPAALDSTFPLSCRLGETLYHASPHKLVMRKVEVPPDSAVFFNVTGITAVRINNFIWHKGVIERMAQWDEERVTISKSLSAFMKVSKGSFLCPKCDKLGCISFTQMKALKSASELIKQERHHLFETEM